MKEWNKVQTFLSIPLIVFFYLLGAIVQISISAFNGGRKDFNID